MMRGCFVKYYVESFEISFRNLHESFWHWFLLILSVSLDHSVRVPAQKKVGTEQDSREILLNRE